MGVLYTIIILPGGFMVVGAERSPRGHWVRGVSAGSVVTLDVPGLCQAIDFFLKKNLVKHGIDLSPGP